MLGDWKKTNVIVFLKSWLRQLTSNKPQKKKKIACNIAGHNGRKPYTNG